MATAKAKWGFRGSSWKHPFQFNEVQKKEIESEIGKQPPEFFVQLEGFIENFIFNENYANQMPRAAEIRVALDQIGKQTKQLRDSLAGIDAYSECLIDDIRSQVPDFTVNRCFETLGIMLVAVNKARKRTANTNVKGGTPRTSARKEFLAAQVTDVFGKFGIAVTTQSFDSCLSVILEAAGVDRGMEPETVTRLRRKTAKNNKR